jgi:hypothetical protein
MATPRAPFIFFLGILMLAAPGVGIWLTSRVRVRRPEFRDQEQNTVR